MFTEEFYNIFKYLKYHRRTLRNIKGDVVIFINFNFVNFSFTENNLKKKIRISFKTKTPMTQ